MSVPRISVILPAHKAEALIARAVKSSREAFAAVGGFDERFLASEEVEFSRAMRRLGRFVVLREKVMTSGRKVRQYTPGQLLRMIWGHALRGPSGAWRRREGLDVWYDAPREADAGTESGGGR